MLRTTSLWYDLVGGHPTTPTQQQPFAHHLVPHRRQQMHPLPLAQLQEKSYLIVKSHRKQSVNLSGWLECTCNGEPLRRCRT